MVNYTYNEIILSMAEKLAQAGIPNSPWEARELAGCALGFNCRSRFDGKTQADEYGVKQCALLLARRLNGEPLQYIIGEWDFYGESFEVGEGVLIPRADTETIIDSTRKLAADKHGLTVTDLCSGTGCIGITLNRVLDCEKVYCVEKSPLAFDYLERNIKRHNCGDSCEAVLGDVLLKETAEKLPLSDILVCNPPYINAEDMTHLQREVTYEPKEALYGGEDGYDYYRAIVRIWKSRLKENGFMVFEIGAGQEDEVMEIMIQAGLRDVRVRKDMAGINRCVYGKNYDLSTTNLYEKLAEEEQH